MFSLMPWTRERTSSRSLAPRTEPLSLFRSDLEEWFNRFFPRWPTLFEEGLMAPEGLAMEETAEASLVRIDAPGFEPGELNVRVEGETLTVEAEHKVEGEGKTPTIERRLRRVVTLPTTIIPEKVEAVYHNGVLEVKLPRIEPVKPLKIEVKAT